MQQIDLECLRSDLCNYYYCLNHSENLKFLEIVIFLLIRLKGFACKIAFFSLLLFLFDSWYLKTMNIYEKMEVYSTQDL